MWEEIGESKWKREKKMEQGVEKNGNEEKEEETGIGKKKMRWGEREGEEG